MVTRKRTTKKKKGKAGKSSGVHEDLPGVIRTGMPSKDSVIGETSFESPKGTKYRILRTTEIDTYDIPEKKNKDKNRK